jgi:uncharacterized protein (TIGR02646 family)
MRKIDKQKPLPCFDDFKRNNPGADWNHNFSKPNLPSYECYKESRETILMEEQLFLCGYAELLIEDEKSSHIDHYIKRSLDNTKTFDWNNLIVSCNDDDFGARYKDMKSKISLEAYLDIFNPVVDIVQDYFEYLANGEVISKSKGISQPLIERANKTIEVFNLNEKSLKSHRRDLIRMIESYKSTELSILDIEKALENTGFQSVKEQYLVA